MSCLDNKNYVGLRDSCGDDLIATTTGYYVDELPGINLEVIAAGHGPESANAQSEIQKAINLAKRVVADRVRAHLKTRYSLDSNVESRTTGLFETQTAQAAQAQYVGQNIRIRNNPNAELYVTDMNLAVNYTGTVTVKAWDLFSGEELQSKAVTVTPGIPASASLDWTFAPKGGDLDIFIGYDATSVPSYVTRIASGWCHTCKGGVYNTRYAHVYAKKHTTSSNPNRSTIQGANGTAGLSLRWGVNCAADPFLCSMGDALALPMWYYVGYVLYNRMQYSKRLSPDVLAYDADYEQMKEDARQNYEASFMELLHNVRVPKNDCFKCQSPTQIAIKV